MPTNASNAKRAPRCGVLAAGVDPPNCLAAGRSLTGHASITALGYSERCCGMPARRARTSVSRYRRCPPSVRMDVSFPAFAHLVTVFGSTLNIVATSAGVSSGSASGVRADMLTASPPGPVLRSLLHLLFVAHSMSLPRMSHIVHSDHIAITSGNKSTTGSKVYFASRRDAPLRPVTQRDSSDTQRRNGRIRKSHPRLPSAT
jgi:hypothetical protein